ncbi:hypothetical protein [Nitrosomonas sp.]
MVKNKEMTLIDWQTQYEAEEGCAQSIDTATMANGFLLPVLWLRW